MKFSHINWRFENNVVKYKYVLLRTKCLIGKVTEEEKKQKQEILP